MNSKRLIYLALIMGTLSIGVIIGTIVSGGVKATSEQKPPVLTIPEPVTMSNSFSQIAAQLEPAVVNINVEIAAKEVTAPRRGQGGGNGRRPGGGNGGSGGNGPNNLPPLPPGTSIDPNSPLGEIYGHILGGDIPELEPEPSQATGTGFIIDKTGYILTNQHVVDNATKITVKLADKSDYPAHLIGSDSYTDLAVIKIDAGHDLQVAKFGNSDGVNTGDWVLAVGSPFGFDHTVTSGIISAKGRSAEDLSGGGGPPSASSGFQNFLQTDAAINPGNSGGPLVNMAGEVIGINTAIVSETNSFAGLGFALPSNIAIKVYNQLAQNGKVTRGSIGISYEGNPSVDTLRAFGVTEGVVVDDILAGKPAAQAGIRAGDVITAIDGQKITSGPMLLDVIASSPVDHAVQIKILRNGSEQSIPVMIGDRERVVGGGDSTANTTAADVPAAAAPADRVLGISVQPVPQAIVKKFALSGVAISAIQKGSLAADLLGTQSPADMPLVIDSLVVDDHITDIRLPADFDRAVAALKRGTKVAFGMFLPSRDDQKPGLKYEHTYRALTMP